MSLRLLTPVFLLTVALSAQAQEAVPATGTGTKPLNLSLPRDAVWSSTTRSSADSDVGQGNRGNGLPDLGGSTGQRGRMPYGSGYEARQRGMADSARGSQAGSGGGPRGMGMGRGR